MQADHVCWGAGHSALAAAPVCVLMIALVAWGQRAAPQAPSAQQSSTMCSLHPAVLLMFFWLVSPPNKRCHPL